MFLVRLQYTTAHGKMILMPGLCGKVLGKIYNGRIVLNEQV
jgi:hypothetical protein